MIINGLYFSLILYAAYKDYKTMRVQDWMNLLIIALAFVSIPHIFLFRIVCAGVLTTPILFVAVKTNKIGGGDVKFIFANGCMLGFKRAYAGLIIGLGIVSFQYLIFGRRKKEKNRKIPLIPYLAAGFLLVSFI